MITQAYPRKELELDLDQSTMIDLGLCPSAVMLARNKKVFCLSVWFKVACSLEPEWI